jgi:hypothetical protein
VSRAGHLGRIVLAYVLSCLPPAIWFGVDTSRMFQNYDERPWQVIAVEFLTDVLTIGTIVGAYMAIPALGAIWLAERRRWVSPVAYIVFGTCAPILVLLLLGLLSGELKNGLEVSFLGRMALELGTLGLISGLTYWLIAGRASGALRDAWAERSVAP